MRISDWSSDVCASDLHGNRLGALVPGIDDRIELVDSLGHLLKREIDQQNGILLNNAQQHQETDEHRHGNGLSGDMERQCAAQRREHQRSHIYKWRQRSEEHTSELQSLMRISYAVFCLKKKNTTIYTR